MSAALCVLTGMASAEPAPGSDWATFLGPTGDGKSSETGILKSWKDNGPSLLWHVEAGEGYAAPAVADGRLFLFDRKDDNARLTCLAARTGKQVWRVAYATDYEDLYDFSDGPRAAPVVDGDRVYTFGAEGRLRCHRVKDGSLIWDVDTAKTFGVVQNFFGTGSSPVVEGELLIVAVGGSPPDSPGIQSGKVVGNGSGIVAFDKRTGKVRYKVTDELASYSTPTIATIGDRRWGFWFARGGLIGFEPTSGKVDFHFPFRAKKLESVNASNPVVVEDTVFITESYGPGSAVLRVAPGEFEVVRQDPNPRVQSMSAHFMTPIHHRGYLYGSHGQGSGEAELRAVEFATGKVAWSTPGLGRVTLLYADGHLVVYTERGRVLLVEATPERYHVVADATPMLPATPADSTGATPGGPGQLLDYPAWSPPVLSRGVLYLRAKDRLAAFAMVP
jgi:outer membrane protein assembly factor BamB